jgi:hypothetical protein
LCTKGEEKSTLNDFYRIGEKLISMEKLQRSLDKILYDRSQGLSQQVVARSFEVDRSFVSRLERLGEVRKGARLAVVGFPIKNKDEIIALLEELGVDYSLIMTNTERWRFVDEKNGIELFNEVMQITAQMRTYDVVVLLGSRQRIKWCAALLDKEVLGIELGESPLTEDIYVDPEKLRDLIKSVH